MTKDIRALQEEAQSLRRDVIKMAYAAGSGHCGGSLSCAEIMVVLYRNLLQVRPQEADWPDRDRFILSKGHAAPILYAMLARMGFFPDQDLQTLRRMGSALQGHPDMNKVPGIEMSSGSLGMGLSNGIGMAWAAQRKDTPGRVVVLVGDGELDEGQNWEAAMLAAKLDLANLALIVDRNRVQLDGTTDAILPLGDLAAKFQAFGWGVESCNGHDCAQLIENVERAMAAPQPTVVIADTIKGKGVPFMEGDHQWHGKPLDGDDYNSACTALGQEGSE